MNKEDREFHSHFPGYISKEIREYAYDVVLKHSRYIYIYNKTSPKSHHGYIGYCTSCKKKIRGARHDYRHREAGYCPNCNGRFEVRFEKHQSKKDYDEGYFIYFEKSKSDPKTVIARGFYCYLDYNPKKDFEKIQTVFKLEAKYVFRIKKPRAYVKTRYWDYKNKCSVNKFLRAKTIYNLADQSYYQSWKMSKCISRESAVEAVKDTDLKFCCIEQMKSVDPIKYLATYCRYPNVEKLIRVGLEKLVLEKCSGLPSYKSVSWNKGNLMDMLKIDKGDWNSIRKCINEVNSFTLRVYQMLKEKKYNHSFSEIYQLANERIGSYERPILFKLMEHLDVIKLIKYLKNENKSGYLYIDNFLRDYNDYFETCQKLNYDMSNKEILFPKNFKAAHDKTNNLLQFRVNKEKNMLIKKRINELSRYEFSYNDLEIYIPQSCTQFITEGEKLHHCVARYIEKHINKNTIILFIRKSNQKTKPYFTMEVFDEKVVQAQGKCHKDYREIPEVKEFVEKFSQEKLKSKKTKTKI